MQQRIFAEVSKYNRMSVEIIFPYFPSLSSNQERQFAALGSVYTDWNKRLNLISRRDIDQLYLRHVLHALGIAKVVRFLSGANVLDVGTGGGFPGVPLAILFPQTKFHLVDATGKKIKAVQSIVEELELQNVTTEWERAEKLQTTYDFVVGRGVSDIATFCTWTMGKVGGEGRHSKPNGILYLRGNEPVEGVSYPHTIYPLTAFFAEAFFSTKCVVHVKADGKDFRKT